MFNVLECFPKMSKYMFLFIKLLISHARWRFSHSYSCVETLTAPVLWPRRRGHAVRKASWAASGPCSWTGRRWTLRKGPRSRRGWSPGVPGTAAPAPVSPWQVMPGEAAGVRLWLRLRPLSLHPAFLRGRWVCRGRGGPSPPACGGGEVWAESTCRDNSLWRRCVQKDCARGLEGRVLWRVHISRPCLRYFL